MASKNTKATKTPSTKKVEESLLSSTRPVYRGKDLPAVPDRDKYMCFDQWLRAFIQYIAINVNDLLAESIEIGQYVPVDKPIFINAKEDDTPDMEADRRTLNVELIKIYAKKHQSIVEGKRKAL